MRKINMIISLVLTFILSSILTLNNKVNASDNINENNESYYLYDYNSNTVILSKNENKRMPIASMTKIMLLLLCYENIENNNVSLDTEITISKNAKSMGGSQVYLEEGDSYAIGDLLKSITVASANDASVQMAEYFYGSEQACVDAMNKKASELGLENTLFANVTGLPKPMQYSSAKDISIIYSRLLNYEKYFNYSTIWTDKIEHKKGHTEITNTNKLVKFYEGCDGGKTGFTNEAGFCLTATAKRGNMRLIASVLKGATSKDRFNTISSLFNYGFNNYTNKVVIDKELPIDEKLSISGGKVDSVTCVYEKDYYVFSKRNENQNIEIVNNFNKVKAPLKQGDIVGEAIIYKDSVEIAKINILSGENVEKLTYFDNIKKIIGSW